MHRTYNIWLHALTLAGCYTHDEFFMRIHRPSVMKKNQEHPAKLGHKSSPAHYQIDIAGELASDWGEYFDAISIPRRVDARQNSVTTLTCAIKDQAQLIGILNMLYEWGSVLIRIEFIDVA